MEDNKQSDKPDTQTTVMNSNLNPELATQPSLDYQKPTKSPNSVPRALLALLSIAALLLGIFGAAYATFTVGGSSATKAEYASAFMLLFCLGVSCVVAAVGLWRKQTIIAPMLVSFVLFFASFSTYKSIDSGSSFSILQSTAASTYSWLIFALIVSTPLAYIGLTASIKSGSAKRKGLAIFLCAAVPILLLLLVARPIEKEASASLAAYRQEKARNAEQTRAEEAESRQQEIVSDQFSNELKAAAYTVVVNISDNTKLNKPLTTTVDPPEGYEFSEYFVHDKSNLKFCLKPIGRAGYNMGVIVNSSQGSGTLYWPNGPIGGDACKYSDDDYRKISP